LAFDTSTLESLSLEGTSGNGETASEILRREAEELEMANALREVEKKRLEMQREIERQRTVMGEGVDVEGTVIKRKKKKTKPKVEAEEGPSAVAGPEEGGEAGDVVKKKKKKKRKVVLMEESLEGKVAGNGVTNENGPPGDDKTNER